jgi:hypothetical protein
MSVELRPYQIDISAEFERHVECGDRSILLVAPTGFGTACSPTLPSSADTSRGGSPTSTKKNLGTGRHVNTRRRSNPRVRC